MINAKEARIVTEENYFKEEERLAEFQKRIEEAEEENNRRREASVSPICEMIAQRAAEGYDYLWLSIGYEKDCTVNSEDIWDGHVTKYEKQKQLFIVRTGHTKTDRIGVAFNTIRQIFTELGYEVKLQSDHQKYCCCTIHW